MSVLLCYDGSPSARRALEVAHATLAHKPLTLLHVWNPPEAVLVDSFGASSLSAGPSTDELEGLALGRAQEILGEGEELARASGFVVDGRAERAEAPTWRIILEVADELDAELIIVGTHGTTAVESVLLGSVSNAVVHHSRRPVLAVPDPSREEPHGNAPSER